MFNDLPNKCVNEIVCCGIIGWALCLPSGLCRATLEEFYLVILYSTLQSWLILATVITSLVECLIDGAGSGGLSHNVQS